MDWSAMFTARTVVFGCGNTLFGDDGAAPVAVSQLACEQPAQGVAFVDAGTSVRTLLADLLLSGARPKRVVLVDVVMEPGVASGCVRQSEPPALPGGGGAQADGAVSLHQAPTTMLLSAVRERLGSEVRIVTMQAEHIPELMDEGLSPPVLAALPVLKQTILQLCAENGADAAKPYRSQA